VIESTTEPLELHSDSEDAGNVDSGLEYPLVIQTGFLDQDEYEIACDEDPLDLNSVQQKQDVQTDGEHFDRDPDYICENQDSSSEEEDAQEFHSDRLELAKDKERMGNVQCTKCSKGFLKDEQLKLHFRWRHQSMKCEYCGRSYSGRNGLLVHFNRQHPEHKIKFQCSTCGERFSTPFLLSSHKTKFHGNNEFKCSHCPVSFKEKKNLENHVASIHNSHRLPCIHCGKKFKVKEYLRDHIRSVHPDIFPKTFRKAHLTGGDAERKHRCTKCTAAFKYKHHLVDHLKAVHGPKNLPCPHCNLMFNKAGNLRRHVKNLHSSLQQTKEPETVENVAN